MKREIVCGEDCSPHFDYKFVTDDKGNSFIANPYPGEYCRKVAGYAYRYFRCDMCNKQIRPGDACIAVSIYTDSNPYFEWEHDYVDTKDFFDSPEYLERHPQFKG